MTIVNLYVYSNSAEISSLLPFKCIVMKILIAFHSFGECEGGRLLAKPADK